MNGPRTQEVTSREERRTLRAQLVQEDFLRFQAKAVREFGPAAGILCRHLLFWDGKGWDEEGWIYRSEAEIEELEGLVRNQFRQARKRLREADVLEEERRPGLPPRNFYRLKLKELAKIIMDKPSEPSPKNWVSVEVPGSLDIHKQRQEVSTEVSSEISSKEPFQGPKNIKKEEKEENQHPADCLCDDCLCCLDIEDLPF